MKNELEQKYYDLAVDFVKNHRKYETCSDFLDEIVDDVMNRSMSVIENVNDEAVISSYIQKMVSNSIITISKKHNVTTRVKKDFKDFKAEIKADKELNNLSEEISISDTSEPKEETNIIDEIKEEEIITPDSNTEDNQELQSLEDSSDIIENLDIDNVDSIEVIETDDSFDLLEQETPDVVSDIVPETSEEIEETEEIETVTETEEPNNEFHQNYVDDMINGINFLPQDSQEEAIDLNETEDFNSNTEEPVLENIGQEDMLTEFSENEETLTLVDVDTDNILPEENILEENGPLDENLMQYEESDLTLDQLDQESDIEELQIIEEHDLLEDGTNLSEENEEKNVLNKLYERFSYTPNTEPLNENFEDKENELKILSDEDMNILYLKYKKNLSVNEIAAQTEKDVSEVIDILNTAIDLIKD